MISVCLCMNSRCAMHRQSLEGKDCNTFTRAKKNLKGCGATLFSRRSRLTESEAAHWSALNEHAFELRLPARRARRPRIADRLQVNGFEPLTLGGARAFAQTYKTALSTSLNLFRPYESPRTTRPDEAVRASSFLLVVERGRGATAAAVESLRSGPARLQSVRGSREHRRAVDR